MLQNHEYWEDDNNCCFLEIYQNDIFKKLYPKIQKFSWNFHEINDVRKATLTL
jgi:hypothetical protein